MSSSDKFLFTQIRYFLNRSLMNCCYSYLAVSPLFHTNHLYVLSIFQVRLRLIYMRVVS
nr:MAG TPA: hypothetical protein [Bacteriophage sp.]